jgi:hypothetical protein
MKTENLMSSAPESHSARCPSCGGNSVSIFYALNDVPVHSVVLIHTSREATNFPTGRIALGFCDGCGFIANTAFDPRLVTYSETYEETQGFSPTFNSFHRTLATHLIQRYALHGKRIIEIGCGKGEFLTLICELGRNRGVGFDPSYIPERGKVPAGVSVEFVTDLYSPKYAHYRADFICCKMTLEHIDAAGEFLRTVRRAIGDQKTVVFFQVPDATRILKDVAFWDVYYEHCAYFTAGSLARLFRTCGFELLNLERGYAGQYLMVEACPNGAPFRSLSPFEEPLEALAADVTHFAVASQQNITLWRRYLTDMKAAGRRAVVWGGGSKAVAFLTTLNISDEIAYTIDINPYKAGTFVARTAQQIMPPSFLASYRPDVVIIMNSVYRNEIGEQLKQMNLHPEVVVVDGPVPTNLSVLHGS